MGAEGRTQPPATAFKSDLTDVIAASGAYLRLALGSERVRVRVRIRILNRAPLEAAANAAGAKVNTRPFTYAPPLLVPAADSIWMARDERLN